MSDTDDQSALNDENSAQPSSQKFKPRPSSWPRRALHDLEQRRNIRQEVHRFDRSPERDAVDNERYRLPEGEDVQLSALWLTELFGPSTVNGLTRGLVELGFDRTAAGSHSRGPILDQIARLRSGHGGTWFPLDSLRPRGHGPLYGSRPADLPDGVSLVAPTLYAIGGGLTALTVMFVFEEQYAAQLGTILRADYATEFRPVESPDLVQRVWAKAPPTIGMEILSPDHVRAERATDWVDRRHRDCAEWLSRYFPGAFAEEQSTSSAPSIQLFLTEVIEPCRERDPMSPRAAINALRLDNDFEAWKTEEWPAVRMLTPDRWNRKLQSTLTIGCRRPDAFPKNRASGDVVTSNWDIAQRANDLVLGLSSRWACTCLLVEHQRRLSRLRDIGVARTPKSRHAMRDLKLLRRMLASESQDARTAARQLRRFASEEALFRFNTVEFTHSWSPDGQASDFLTSLREGQLERCAFLEEDLESVMSALTTDSNLAGVLSNTRLQRAVLVLTVIALAVALWTAAITQNDDRPSPPPPTSATVR